MRIGDNLQLAYCSQLHGTEGWAAMFAHLRHYAPRLKERLAPRKPFGLGLCLSARESNEVLSGKTANAFAAFLREHALYVFTLSGPACDPAADASAVSRVPSADWASEARVQHTLRLAAILRALLPEGVEGSIATLGLSYRSSFPAGTPAPWARMSENLARITAALAEIRAQSGQLIHLDLEPEPETLLENSADVIDFYEHWLLPTGIAALDALCGWPAAAAEAALRLHIRICIDSCHASASFEPPALRLQRIASAGIGIGKLQVGAALKGRFRGAVSAPNEEREWRVHAHFPLFIDRLGQFQSTRDETQEALELLAHAPLTHQIEIETDSGQGLPSRFRHELAESIEREYRWVLHAWSHPRTTEDIAYA
jgi:sugar phosphate isomerase/epimerase